MLSARKLRRSRTTSNRSRRGSLPKKGSDHFHVERWRDSRFGGATSQLADIAQQVNWETHSQRTIGAVRSTYLRMPSEQKLWLRGRDFVNADREALKNALGTIG